DTRCDDGNINQHLPQLRTATCDSGAGIALSEVTTLDYRSPKVGSAQPLRPSKRLMNRSHYTFVAVWNTFFLTSSHNLLPRIAYQHVSKFLCNFSPSGAERYVLCDFMAAHPIDLIV
ncbi:unnamed protein product, partial [Mycena citricolor]